MFVVNINSKSENCARANVEDHQNVNIIMSKRKQSVSNWIWKIENNRIIAIYYISM